jgi:chromosome partitioning protein
MRSIAWLSEKGGTGKTTSALNSAVGLARRGRRVLLVDVDPQANSTLVLQQGGIAAPPTLADVLLGRADADAAIRPTRYEGLDLLPADVTLADANLVLAHELGRERRLRAALGAVEAAYDFVLLDTSPQRSLLNVNVLNYVQEVLVPVDPGLFSLSGLGQLQAAVAEVVRHLDNRRLRIAGLVLTRMQRNNVCRDVEARLRELFGDLVLATVIPHSIKLEEAHGRFVSVLDYAPRSAGARAYLELVAEIEAQATADGRVEEDRLAG